MCLEFNKEINNPLVKFIGEKYSFGTVNTIRRLGMGDSTVVSKSRIAEYLKCSIPTISRALDDTERGLIQIGAVKEDNGSFKLIEDYCYFLGIFGWGLFLVISSR